MGFKTISGGRSWSEKAVRSQTVADYVEKKGRRPEPKVLKEGNRFRILTGAQVTRKRKLNLKGTFIAFREGSKTFFKSIAPRKSIRRTAKQRRDRNAVLNAGQKFDGGINKLVEDMAKGENMLGKSRGRVKFDKRMEALYEQAKTLKARGGFSDADIAERFRTNLMESLQVLQQEGSKEDYERVLKQLTQEVLPQFEWSVGSPATDKNAANNPANKQHDLVMRGLEVGGLDDPEEHRREQEFNRSVVVAGLRDVATFGYDKKNFEAFGGSRLKHDAFGGDPDAMETFRNDPAAYRSFNGNQDAFKKWGGCGPLYEKFGGNPAALKGEVGAAALRDFLNDTYGPGRGDAFLEAHGRLQKGVDPERGLYTLGLIIQNELGEYQGLGYDHLDLKLDNVVNGPDTPLKAAFDDLLKMAKTGEAVGNWPVLECLRDLETLRGNPDSYDEDTLRQKIKDVAQKVMMPDSAIYVPSGAKTQFQKQIAEQAGYSYNIFDPSMKDSLDHLEALDTLDLLKVVSEGLEKVDKALRGTIRTVLADYGKRSAAENTNRLHNLRIGQLIENAYGGDGNAGIGKKMVNWRLDAKGGKIDKVTLDEHDLRIIEKELYKEGHVRTDANQDIKKDIK